MDSRVPFSTIADENTVNQIARRVADYKASQESSHNNQQDIEAHIDALSHVFELDKQEVERIAADVLVRNAHQQTFKDKLFEGVVKYSKEVIVSIVIALVVVFLLFGRSQVQSLPIAQSQSFTSINSENTPDFSRFKNKAKMANILNTVFPVRVMLSEFYVNEGKYPEKFEDLGVTRAEMSTGRGIADIMLGESGKIIVKASEDIGDNILAVFSPQSTMGGMNIEWKCETNLAAYLPGCKRIDAQQYIDKF